MKLLCTGDWHVHSFTDFSETLTVRWDKTYLRYAIVKGEENDTKEMNSRLFNILSGLCTMRDYCLKNQITDVLMAGDMFHRRANIDVTVFNSTHKVLKSFKKCGVTVHAIAGNHDQVDSSQIPSSAIHSFEDVIHVIEKPTLFAIKSEEDEEVEVVAVPYSKDKKFILSSIEELKGQCISSEESVLMVHLGLTGGKVGSGMYIMSDEYSLGDLQYDHWKYVVCGHYHQPQLLSHNSFYCGTPIQNSFNDELPWEDGYNGFFVVDTSKRYDIEFVPIYAPRFITVSSAKDLENYDADTLEANYVRVKASAENVEEIQETLGDILGEDSPTEVRLELEKNYDKNNRSEIGVSMSYEDAVKTYVEEKYDKDDKAKVTDVGLSIMSEAEAGGN